MKFSNREQFGLRAMVEFARRYGNGLTSLVEVAEAQGISLSYMEQVVMPLRHANLLTSRRGVHGGYSLARPPEQITAGDVIRAVKGPLVPVRCLIDDDSVEECVREARCETRIVWLKVQQRLEEALDSITLADLLEQTTELPGAQHCDMTQEDTP
jgi:Rrf2 family cysteine metabolism transcriptional repressor